MKYYSSESRTVQGSGLLNDIINKLPFEVHLPGYNFCGPGTKLQERLARGDKGINQLDEACKEHDIAYSIHKALPDRHQADKILLKNALTRINARDASWKEKLAAIGVSAAMNKKLQLGMGYRKNGRDTNNKKKINSKYNQYTKKLTKMTYPAAAVKQTTAVIRQSINTTQHYLTKMETLLSKINGNRQTSPSQKNQKKKSVTTIKKRKIKKPQSDEEEEETHIDNYHERELKKKIANRLAAAAALPVKRRKRKIENTEAEVLEKRFKQDIQNMNEKPITNEQKRKRSDDDDDDDDDDNQLEEYGINKKIKLLV